MDTTILVLGIIFLLIGISIGIPAIHVVSSRRRLLKMADDEANEIRRSTRKRAEAIIAQATNDAASMSAKAAADVADATQRLDIMKADEQELNARMRAAARALGQQTDLANSKAAILDFVTDEDLLDSSAYQSERNDIRSEIKKLAQDAVIGTKGLNTGLSPIKFATIQAKADIAGALLVTTVEMLAAKITAKNGIASMDKLNEAISATEALVQTVDTRLKLDRSFADLLRKRLQAEFDYRRAKARAAEEQRELREQQREEVKARQEAERAAAEARKEQEIRERALAEMKATMEAQMAEADGAHRAEMMVALAFKQAELDAAIAAAQRTAARAESTKQGHVYIISNIGSFGKDVYKIGMTRRLNPLDRVKELGDASVPFCFDIHALIECDDAPSLENRLHHEFASRRLNRVNLRKEFFRVSIDDIQDHLTKKGINATINLVPSADEYYASIQAERDGAPVGASIGDAEDEDE